MWLVLALTVNQHHGLLERERVPDLHLAVRTLQHVDREEENEGRRLLDALEHALLGQIVSTVVVPHLEAHALELKVNCIGLVSSCAL